MSTDDDLLELLEFVFDIYAREKMPTHQQLMNSIADWHGQNY